MSPRGHNLGDYLEDHEEEIHAAAVEYHATHPQMTFAECLRDIRDEYADGFCDGEAASRTTDWDYGRE